MPGPMSPQPQNHSYVATCPTRQQTDGRSPANFTLSSRQLFFLERKNKPWSGSLDPYSVRLHPLNPLAQMSPATPDMPGFCPGYLSDGTSKHRNWLGRVGLGCNWEGRLLRAVLLMA